MKKLSTIMLILFTYSVMGQKRVLTSEDLLLKNYVMKEFNINIPPRERDIDTVLLNKNSPSKEILIYPEKYKLRAYEFYFEYGYSPFAIRIMNNSDSILSFFSFTDELYYLSNEVSGEFLFRNQITIKRTQNRKPLGAKNLENNLNDLIHKLGYQNNQEKIKHLLVVVFTNLLSMERMNETEIHDINFKLSKIKSKDPKIKECIKEFNDLENLPDSTILCVKAKEGMFGYWVFSFDKELNKVKVKFVGDLIYFNIYM